jgi:hypothetical protein
MFKKVALLSISMMLVPTLSLANTIKISSDEDAKNQLIMELSENQNFETVVTFKQVGKMGAGALGSQQGYTLNELREIEETLESENMWENISISAIYIGGTLLGGGIGHGLMAVRANRYTRIMGKFWDDMDTLGYGVTSSGQKYIHPDSLRSLGSKVNSLKGEGYKVMDVSIIGGYKFASAFAPQSMKTAGRVGGALLSLASVAIYRHFIMDDVEQYLGEMEDAAEDTNEFIEDGDYVVEIDDEDLRELKVNLARVLRRIETQRAN